MRQSVPTVLIVMRTRDRPTLLARALDDVLSQTFLDWHLVVVNDGGAVEPVERALQRRCDDFDGRLTVIHTAQSSGMEAASNRGIAASPSRFITIHDDDDTWHPQFLERTTDHLTSHPDEIGVATRVTIVWETIDASRVTETGRELFLPSMTDLLLTDLLKFNRFVPISFVYRREVHDIVGQFRGDLRVVGDWEFHLRVLSQFAVGFLADEPLAFWHQRPGASGAIGNSVITDSGEHDRFDARVRNEYFLDYVRREGIGLPLYLTQLIDERMREAESSVEASLASTARQLGDRLDKLEARVVEHGVFGSLRRSPAAFAGWWRRRRTR